jgi:hypothetical protein
VGSSGQRLSGNVGEDEARAHPLHQFERLDSAAGLRLGAGQQFDRGRGRLQPTMAVARLTA